MNAETCSTLAVGLRTQVLRSNALPVVAEAPARIGMLYDVNWEIRGRSPDARVRLRQARAGQGLYRCEANPRMLAKKGDLPWRSATPQRTARPSVCVGRQTAAKN